MVATVIPHLSLFYAMPPPCAQKQTARIVTARIVYSLSFLLLMLRRLADHKRAFHYRKGQPS